MLKLYEYHPLLQEAIEAHDRLAVDHDTGEITDESWEEFLDAIKLEMKEKVLQVARYVKSLDAESDAIKAEAKKLNDRKKSLENRAERFRQYIASNLTEGEKIQDTTTLLSWRKSESVETCDVNFIPTQYLRIIKEADKAAIKDALKKGVIISGCNLVTKNNLIIK